MILANELRIGNYVSDIYASNEGMWQVTAIRNQICNYGTFTAKYEDLRPIPLTPEILEKCGFEYIMEVGGFCNKDHIIYECGESGEFWWEFHPFCTNDVSVQLEVHYLHHLQNLNFTLTGEELTPQFQRLKNKANDTTSE